MRRICYLHVGLPKTGTTAIQHRLRSCTADFASVGFLVPQTGLTRDHGGHNRLALWLGGDPQFEKTGPEFVAELNGSDAQSVVISSEKIAKRLLERDFMTSLFEKLAALDLEPRFILVVRNQPQLFNSGYSQLAKTLRWGGTFAEYLASHETTSPSFNMRLVDAVAAKGAPLTVLGHGPDIVPAFLDTIGVPEAAVPCESSDRKNPSVGPLTVELARTTHRHLPQLTPAEANECWRILKALLLTSGVADNGYSGLTTKTAREIEANFAGHNDAFARRVWGRPWTEVFGTDIGREFEPNDYQLVGVPADVQPLLASLTIQVREQCEAMLAKRRAKIAARA